MTDIRADEGMPTEEEDRLPWLEAVDEEEERAGPSALKLIAAVLIGLVAIGAIVGGIFWIGNRDGQANRDAELIAAPQGDYKVRPDDPGGMTVEGEGDTAFAASAGADPKGAIDTEAVPEAPVTPRPGQQPSASQPAPKAAPKAGPAPAAEPILKAPPPTNAGPSIQLGAFPNAASAEKAWKALAGRFTYLAPLSHSVVSANVNGRTWYRLRASGAGAAGICGRLRVAGEDCLKVD
jgi:hypothetical protein